jgi:hypothetical protein
MLSLSALLSPTKLTAAIDEFKQLIIAADAKRASALLLELCVDYPLLAGIVTLLRQGSINEALLNVGLFDHDLASELRNHMTVLAQVGTELNSGGTP